MTPSDITIFNLTNVQIERVIVAQNYHLASVYTSRYKLHVFKQTLRNERVHIKHKATSHMSVPSYLDEL